MIRNGHQLLSYWGQRHGYPSSLPLNTSYSVIIPAYNAEKTIAQTLDSVLAQTQPPMEILVCDDGSKDGTANIIRSYGKQITPFFRNNVGVDATRNFLCGQANGDMLAFLDADDLWHPRFLEFQGKLFDHNPSAVGYFTEHLNLVGLTQHEFVECSPSALAPVEIDPETFLREYNRRPLSFQMSGFCMPRRMLSLISGDPFCLGGGGDTYLHTMLPLYGSVVHTNLPLVAYRIVDSSLSANQVKSALSTINAFNQLRCHYEICNNRPRFSRFKLVSASRKRSCARHLMGVGRVAEARRLTLSAMGETINLFSFLKSSGLFGMTFLPKFLQPRWLSQHRRLTESELSSGHAKSSSVASLPFRQ